MPHYSVTLLQTRRGWAPSLSNTGVKDLIRTRKMIPHGDRRDRAESGRAEHQGSPTSPRNDRVMREFVLNNHVSYYGRVKSGGLMPTPPQDVRQRFQLTNLSLERREVCGIKGGSVLNLHSGLAWEDAQRMAAQRQRLRSRRCPLPPRVRPDMYELIMTVW